MIAKCWRSQERNPDSDSVPLRDEIQCEPQLTQCSHVLLFMELVPWVVVAALWAMIGERTREEWHRGASTRCQRAHKRLLSSLSDAD